MSQDPTPEFEYGARLIQVIETTLTVRGGQSAADEPCRLVTKYWTPDGELLAERDPHKVVQPDGKKQIRETWMLLQRVRAMAVAASIASDPWAAAEDFAKRIVNLIPDSPIPPKGDQS